MDGMRLILIVDDDQDFGSLLAEIIVEAGYRARHVTTTADACAALDEERPDACLLDWNLQGGDPAGLAHLLSARGVPFALSTGDPSHMEVAERLGARALLEKPFDLDRLTRLLDQLLYEARPEA